MSPKEVSEQIEIIKSGIVQIISEEELRKKLLTGKKLRVKLGADPTAPDLHLGHAVVLSKLKQFQDLGHEIIFLIGDFTASIGDPTGKSKTRPPLSQEEIAFNTSTYFDQVSKILDPHKIRIRFNSEWLDKLTSREIVNLCSKVTLAQLSEREDFANRIEKHESIAFHELLYPLFQGYDSVALDADIELGGTDQTFNLVLGRHLQEKFGQEPQIIITVPLLEGLDGSAKMSKSLGNYIGLIEPAEQAYGKLMSMSDKLMWRYMNVLLQVPEATISSLQERVASGATHPMVLKKDMAHSIITKFWSKAEADAAQAQFEALFQKKDYSQAQILELPALTPNPIGIIELLKVIGSVDTSSEARRLIVAGAVKVDNEMVQDPKTVIAWRPGMIIKVGKHRIYQLK
ncbi:MAG TPA: tyrosine--tRNA ligase [Candidatus Babeliaceae bacterium]|nr:tyrosine--tRNA ligase [Candidatus Babeliaceae bacterium]